MQKGECMKEIVFIDEDTLTKEEWDSIECGEEDDDNAETEE